MYFLRQGGLARLFYGQYGLQQNTKVTFHGKAALGKTLKVTTGWNNEVYVTPVNKDGYWTLSVPTPAAGGPYTLTFTDGKKLQLKNVMVGEVWFCSGQSNMEMPVAGWGKVMNYEQECSSATIPEFRNVLPPQFLNSLRSLIFMPVHYGRS